MPEIALTPKPAIDHAPLGRPGAPLRLSALPEGRVIQVLASPSADPGAVSASLATLGDGGPHAVRPYAPGQWFVVGDTPTGPGEIRRLGEALGGQAAVSDQSHGRVRLALEGPAATRVLGKGCAMDFADAAFPVGQSAHGLYGHFGIHVTRIAPDVFELIVLRGFAQSLWEALEEAGAEFLTERPAVA